MSQKKYLDSLLQGELPTPYDKAYADFVSKVRNTHLILLRFKCGCWRFIEVNVSMKSSRRTAHGITLPLASIKVEHTWSYYYPETDIQCGGRIVNADWIKQNMKIFILPIPFEHNRVDAAFREMSRRNSQVKLKFNTISMN